VTRTRLIEVLVVVVSLLLGYGGITLAERGDALPTTSITPHSVDSSTATVAPAVTFTPAPSPTLTRVTLTVTPTETPVDTPTSTPTSRPTATRTPTPAQIVYVVRSGDTLDSIAHHFGVSADAISQANHLKDPNSVAEGQKLIIPRK
jgi:LysM repeat protein